MDLITAIAILNQNIIDFQVTSNQLMSQASQAYELVKRENSVTAVNPQVHALTGSMNVVITSLHSQLALVQQSVDKVAELSNN